MRRQSRGGRTEPNKQEVSLTSERGRYKHSQLRRGTFTEFQSTTKVHSNITALLCVCVSALKERKLQPEEEGEPEVMGEIWKQSCTLLLSIITVCQLHSETAY